MTEENINTSSEAQDSNQEEVPTSIGSFAKVFLIIDLVFVAIALMTVVYTLVVPAELLELAGTPASDTLLTVISGLGVVILGGVGNVAMLAKKAWGAFLCYGSMLFVALGLILSFTQLEQAKAMVAEVPHGEAMVVASVFITAAIKVGYNIAYVLAVRSGAKNIRLMEQD